MYVNHSPVSHQILFTPESHPDPVYIKFVLLYSVSPLIVFPPLFKRGLPRIPAGADCFSASSLGSSHICGHHLYSVWRDGILIRGSWR